MLQVEVPFRSMEESWKPSTQVHTPPAQRSKRVYVSVVADFDGVTWEEIGGVLVDAVHIYALGVFVASSLSHSFQMV